MKKQFLILAATITTVAFISCSREKLETSSANLPVEEITKPGGGGPTFDPLKSGLLGRYEFNGTLKDTTGKLMDADPTIDRVIFTTDRKGQAKKAIRFNGAYGLDIFDIPFTPDNCSVSFWVKDDVTEGPSWVTILSASHAFLFSQNELQFSCSFMKNGLLVQNTGTAPIDNNWHHIAATRDNTSMKLYIDGVLIGTSPSPAGSLSGNLLHNYLAGYGWGTYWKGNMDDLRFYKRVLSSTEVIMLKNL